MPIYSFTHTDQDRLRFYGDRSQRTLFYLGLAPEIEHNETAYLQETEELRRTGYCHVRGLFESMKVNAISMAARLLIARKQHLGGVRNHAIESPEDIQAGRFSYFAADALAGVDLPSQASSVSIAQPLVTIGGLAQIAFDPLLLGVASAYLGTVPLVSYAKLTTSYPNEIPDADTQLWHADFGSYKLVKAIVYLTNCPPNGGPFAYAKASHTRKFQGWDQHSRYSDEVIHDNYAVQVCNGSAGDVVIADTTGFHRGVKPTTWPRRVLIITYCVHPEYGFVYTPIQLARSDYEGFTPFQKAAADALEIV